jgi:para-aminobenzoate synthetase component II
MMVRQIENRWSHHGPGEIVILDNRDSFVFNLAHRFEELGKSSVVVRSDAIDLETLQDWDPAALVISPGPGHPAQAGISVAAIEVFSGKIPILGVCLGHQAIGQAFGGRVVPSGRPRHGMASSILHDGTGIFDGLPSPFDAARYHSLIVESPLPQCLVATAWTDGFVMALAHRSHPTFGVQFHPESILTTAGYGLLANFLALVAPTPS